jgi:membrane-associated phospholipid phosphatase
MSDETTLTAESPRSFSLPIFLTQQNKYMFSILWVIIGFGLYEMSNHYPIFNPQLLTMTAWDKAIPFWPHTVWVYSSEMFLFFSVYILSKDLINANKYLYSFLALQIVSVAIFLIWPTTYPRELYPLPTDLDPWTNHIFSNLRGVDSPSNCLPSLHVSSVYISAFVYLDEQKKKFPFFFLWATAIALSTLTTKQHYIIDVVGGFLIALTMYLIFHRCVKYQNQESLSGKVVLQE